MTRVPTYFLPRGDDHMVDTHTLFTTGICTYDGLDVVVFRLMLGGHQMELRITAEQARSLADDLRMLADTIEQS